MGDKIALTGAKAIALFLFGGDSPKEVRRIYALSERGHIQTCRHTGRLIVTDSELLELRSLVDEHALYHA